MLQTAIIQEFGPTFARGATVLYWTDADKQALVPNKQALAALGIPALSYDKLPDVVLYNKTRNWVYLIESATSHGPTSPERKVELGDV